MKTMAIRTTTILAVLVLACIAAAPVVAQETGSLTLQGTVPAILEITVTGTGNYNALDLTTDASNLVVATVNERTNSKTGYTVSVKSLNAEGAGSSQAFFAGSDVANTDTLNYNISYGGSAVTLDGSGLATVTDSAGKTLGTGENKDVAITYTGTFLNADTYTDTLVFTIATK
jgi:hypothetical protein